LSKWVVSFDLDSLYPHLIMQYNISPEVYRGKDHGSNFIEKILSSSSDVKYSKGDGKNEYAIAANGCYFSHEKQGFLAALMEKMYNDRVEYKKKMIEAKKEYEKTKNPELIKDIARYHNMQLAKKIQLNSAYGALGNEYFRWFNFNLAEAITSSGQLSIRWIEKRMNEFMNKQLKTKDVDFVVASDTDSIYINMEGFVKQFGHFKGHNYIHQANEREIVEMLDFFCDQKIKPYMDKCWQELAVKMNAYQNKMRMKRETIANKGIWKAKKMYILNAWNVEGVQYDEPKLKMQGIEAVRSSTPFAARDAIKKALSLIMNSDESELITFVEKVHSDFMNLSFEAIASPRGIKGMWKYRDANQIYKKGTPVQVKGALLYNSLIVKYKLKNLPPVQDGDKIKFAYLKTPNPLHDTVIAAPDVLPPEFGLDKYIDRELQFQKTFLEPLKSITEVIGWKTEHKATLENFFG